MTPELKQLFDDLDDQALRVNKPTKFIFLCGGALPDPPGGRPINLRDYLLRIKHWDRNFTIVLAESAIDLYRLTNYGNLIEFEEDIARLSALVVLISESAGALAELGSFASSDVIRPSLRVILPSEHSTARSFVRLGPVKLIENNRRESLAVFPWKSHLKTGHLNVASITPHHSELRNYIREQIEGTPRSFLFRNQSEEQKLLFVILWIIYVSWAISPKILYDNIRGIGFEYTDRQIRDKMYSLEVVGWVKSTQYGSKDYFWSPCPTDPFDYHFKPGVLNDVLRRKSDLSAAMRRDEALSPHIRQLVADARRALT